MTKLTPAISNGRLQRFAPALFDPPTVKRWNVDLFPVSLLSSLMEFTPFDWAWVDYTSSSPIILAYRKMVECLVEQEKRSSQGRILPPSTSRQRSVGSRRRVHGIQRRFLPVLSSMYYLQRSPNTSPRCENMSPTTLGLDNPKSFAGFDLEII